MLRKFEEQKPLESLNDSRFFKIRDWKHASKNGSQPKYVGVNHSLEESSDFMCSFNRNRVFKDPEQILQDRQDKSHILEKPSKFKLPAASPVQLNN